VVRRILDENAGILKTISDILALEALKDPILFPIFPTNDEIVMFSDYSRGSGYFILGSDKIQSGACAS